VLNLFPARPRLPRATESGFVDRTKADWVAGRAMDREAARTDEGNMVIVSVWYSVIGSWYMVVGVVTSR
jgi:hypothetical protein